MNNVLEGLNTSEKLRVFMAAKKFNPMDIANLLSVTRETVNNRLESDKWFIGDLKKIAAEYDIDIQDLT